MRSESYRLVEAVEEAIRIERKQKFRFR